MIIGKHTLKPGKMPFVIAEIGTAHQGDIIKAKELIDAAKDSGADCAKFQIVFAEEILHPKTGVISLPGGFINLFDIFKKLEKDRFFYEELKLYTEKKGLIFLASAFGRKSLGILEGLKVDAIKIASPENNYFGLMQKAAELNLPVFFSTGVSKLADIEEALEYLPKQVVLFHCITSYPSPEEEYNLTLLKTLSQIFGVPAAVSDHSTDPSLVPLVAMTQGAVAIEKHFTLSRKDDGLDDLIALPPQLFKKMTDDLQTGSKLQENELQSYLDQNYGAQRIQQVLGNGIKKLAPSEKDNYATTRRSIHAWDSLPVGTTLTEKNLAILRSEKNLEPGLHPRYWNQIIGRKTTRFVEAGQGIIWDDLLTK
ncbi:MAG: N-acetylneuraminate synthase family protein [Spirochaetales bacterium]|nr:N-acetylneuraminate synthase family protein [Spirochaetales bacterium]